MVLGWQRPGRVGRRRDPEREDVGGAGKLLQRHILRDGCGISEWVMGNGWRGRAAKADTGTPGPRRQAQEDRPRKIDLQREVHEYKPTKIDLRREAYEDRPTKTTGSPMILSSSMAEHSAVNRVVVGSSPTWGASTPHRDVRSFLLQ